VPPLPRRVQSTTLRPGHTPFRPRVIQGGKLSNLGIKVFHKVV
jgi:hypothetical protein